MIILGWSVCLYSLAPGRFTTEGELNPVCLTQGEISSAEITAYLVPAAGPESCCGANERGACVAQICSSGLLFMLLLEKVSDVLEKSAKVEKWTGCSSKLEPAAPSLTDGDGGRLPRAAAPPTLKPVSKEPVPEDPGVEVERVSVLRPEEVRMLNVGARELVRSHSQGGVAHGLGEDQLRALVKRPGRGSLVCVH